LSAPTTSIVSNTFKVTVEEVNDEPVVGDTYLTNTRLNEESTKTWLCLDDATYFTDIEDDELFYKAVIDPEQKYADEELLVYVDSYNYIWITAVGDFTGDNVPVRIYCDDDTDFNEDVNPYQDFKVTVDNIPDDAPFWDPIEPIYIPEDSDLTEVCNLKDYVHDPDTPVSQLDIYLTGNTNSSWLPTSIDDAGMLSVASAQADYDGSTMVTVKAWDGYNYGLTTVWIHVIPENDLPTVLITNPMDNDGIYVDTLFTVIGSGKDPESLMSVEVAYALKGTVATNWQSAQGLTSWKFDWDTAGFERGDQVTIYARSFDGEEYSTYDSVTVIIEEDMTTKQDKDGDGVNDREDVFPDNPYEWADTDKDGYGDNTDMFPDDPNEYLDSDRDGQPDGSDPTPYGVKPEGGSGGGGSGTTETKGGLSFNLWWLVILLVIVEVLFVLFLMVKKVRSRKPVPKRVQKKVRETKVE